MEKQEISKRMKKQGYRFVGNHSAVQICRWTKKSLRDEGVCYKEKFYGIKSHRCCQMTPWLACQNRCIHCWRAVEFDFNKLISHKKGMNSPSEIIDKSIQAQRKLLEGFKILPETKEITVSKANMKKYNEAQEPTQFALSLLGEPTFYPLIGDLIQELRNRKKTSFLVTNGLFPKKLKELYEKEQLPTQLYVSVMAGNRKLFDKIVNSEDKKAWKKLNQTLELMPSLGKNTRTVFRMNLIKEWNMEDKHIKEFSELIEKSQPRIVEIKGFMSVGFARNRLGYEKMPRDKEMKEFVKKLEKELKNSKNPETKKYKFLDEHEHSRAYVLAKRKSDLKIKKSEY
ncbi:MAG TPA: 4-demethylwyosine synthase TYW1 [Candidatus Nanoarchaeia archaeon]|nr:4-demethylwyosine synthase TYW1 [Candidatus Nanoarchaeia archaeon]